MNCILFDGRERTRLLPFTFTRPVADLRAGILSFREKWEQALGTRCSTLTASYLRKKYPLVTGEVNLFVNPAYLPGKDLVRRLRELVPGEAVFYQDALLAACLPEETALSFDPLTFRPARRYEWQEGQLLSFQYPEDLFRLNGEAIRRDFALLTRGRVSAGPSVTNRVAGDGLFIEEGAEVECANINTKTGPVYIGKGALVMEGTNLRGPVAVCEKAVVKMGARIYGPTTVGPACVVGGEVKNSVLTGYSNKGHDGYLGNSVVGQWCNFGADTNASNKKNNYKTVQRWDYELKKMYDTGLVQCGLMMGDYSRTGINTMLNTGTTMGTSCHVFGADFPGTFIPDFTWGGDQVYQLDKALEAAAAIHAQKDAGFTAEDKEILMAIYNFTEQYRKAKS